MTIRFTREKDGTPNGFIGVTRDISERKQLERAMESVINGTQRKVGTDFLNSLAENLAAVLDIKCVLVGELQANDVIKTLSIWVDSKIEENFEYSLKGTPCANLADEFICIYPENVQAQFPEADILRDMGMESYLGASLLDGDGKNIGILVCMDDKPMRSLKFRRDLLTIFSVHASSELSRRQALEGGEVIRRQLLQAQKMESIGQMAGGVAHDFNNLLVVIKGYTDLAEEKTREDAELSGYHNQILGAADRATDLTTQLLSFSSRQILDTEPLDLNVLLNETGNLLERLLPENITYEFIPGANLGIVDGDAGQLEQSVINLAVNARDAMPEGGKLTIETENIIINQNYVETHPWANIGRYVLLRVSDTGTGIPEEIQDLVFEPFFTTKPEGAGTGLGLSVLFGVIKQHGGFTHFYSEIDKGTEFRIYLPIVERTATSLKRKLESKVTRGDETVLLVEDNEQVRTLANTFLSLAGYQVILAEDGEMAIHKFKQHQHEISIVVLDVVLPKADGREVMEEIHKLAPRLPVLFCSGYSANGIHTNFILEDDLVLLQKPYSRDDLLRKIRELLD
jgi:signal transduction histidine kinase